MLHHYNWFHINIYKIEDTLDSPNPTTQTLEAKSLIHVCAFKDRQFVS